jgi:uncharacterized protein (DUF305 family)
MKPTVALFALATWLGAAPSGLAAQGTSVGESYTPEDVAFMTGMIAHHAQAVLMAGWAPTHGASPAVRTLCDRIFVAQKDEILLMQNWLRDRHETAPEGDASHDTIPGMESMMMPGMLTAKQLLLLKRAQGPEFDRLFLTLMIRHHQGALTMVDKLFSSHGGGEETTIFRLASDIYADQETEIGRMQKMLATVLFGGTGQ